MFEVEAGADEKQQIKFVWPKEKNIQTRLQQKLMMMKSMLESVTNTDALLSVGKKKSMLQCLF